MKRNNKKIKIILLKLFPFLLLASIAVAFYWKYFFKGLIPFPGDLLVGAYYPWFEYKWGNIVGVAVKNPFISDIFSEFFVEKADIVGSFINNQWPLWNPNFYSGFPQLASFNTGPLNPFNVLMMIFNKIDGWSLLVFSQALFSSFSMYIFLKKIIKSKYSSLIGSIIYAFGGFSMSWSQYVNAGFVMIWLPLIFFLIEQAKSKKNNNLLLLISPLFFLTVTAGHFQGLVYTVVLSILYFIFRFGIKNMRANIYFATASLLALGLSSIQLIPTIELISLSIRFEDGMIAGNNFGLVPRQNLITMIAPDYFGNHTTGNYWGFYNYHETILYAGVMGFFGLIYGVFYYKKLKLEKFFIYSAVAALLFQFDTFFGRAIYLYKIPFLSTCAAGRVGMIYLFSVSVLAASLVNNLKSLKTKDFIKLLFLPFMFLFVGAIIPFYTNKLNEVVGLGYLPISEALNNSVAIRNLILPFGLISLTGIVLIVGQKYKLLKYLLILIVIADLFRFGWKYLPFVPRLYVFPETEVTEFIKNDQTLFRIDKERAEILPPNTWLGYGFMSSSGFNSLAVYEYVKAYKKDLNGQEGNVSRYSELDVYDAEALGKYNVKYLLAIKRDDIGVPPGDNINYRINENDWERVFQTPAVAVLQNTKYKERARIINNEGDDALGSIKIESYENNKIVVNFKNIDGDRLLLSDTYYPGWRATVNGKRVEIGDEIKPFRTVSIVGMSEGTVVFEYRPDSFKWGMIVSGVSLGIWSLLYISTKRKD